MRQHVNPLSRFFQRNLLLPTAADLFEKKDLPIHLDIGCARGKFLIEMAIANKEWNFIGLEIRESLVIAAEKERVDLGLDNVKFFFCNANMSLSNLLSKTKSNQLKKVSIQFPDPWFKNRHRKRRLLNEDLLLSLAKKLNIGSELFIQTDVHSLMEEMVEIIDRTELFFNNLEPYHLCPNPFLYKTEREKLSLKKGLIIYRKLFIRNNSLAL